MSKSREQLVKYLSEIDITGKVVLDCGAGPKEKWARNFTKGKAKEYITTDIDSKYEVSSIWDLNLLYEEMNLKYDVIFCIEVLEHIWNPVVAIKSFYELLETKGTLYLSSPFINPYHDEVDYARYTSEWYEKVLTEVGFKDIKIKPRVATAGIPHLMDFYQTEGLRMSKTRLKKGQQAKMYEIGYFVEATK